MGLCGSFRASCMLRTSRWHWARLDTYYPVLRHGAKVLLILRLDLGNKGSSMWILPILGYVGVLLGFGFLTLAIGKSCQGRPAGVDKLSVRPLLSLRAGRGTHGFG